MFTPGACSITLYGSVNYGFVVTAKILPVNCQNFVIYDHFAVNYDEKVLWNRPQNLSDEFYFNHWANGLRFSVIKEQFDRVT